MSCQMRSDVLIYIYAHMGRYVGNSAGNILVLKFDGETGHLSQMKYTIPFAVSHGELH